MRIDKLFEPVKERPLRRLPGLLAAAVRITWAAGRNQLILSALLQVLGAVAILMQLLLGRELLEQLLESPVDSGASGDLLPLLLAFAAVTALIAFSNLARAELQRLLGELVSRYTSGRVLDIATSADLLEFEDSDFHNRLIRAWMNAAGRPVQMATGLLTITSALVAIAGVAGALLIIQPLLLGAVLVAYIPAWLANARASKVGYKFSVAQTERDRRRQYLSYLLIDRQSAPEIRAFSLARHLRQRYDQLYDERIVHLRETVKVRLGYGLFGGFVSSVLTAGTIGGLVWMIATERLELAAGGAAAGALLILGQRLQALTGGAGNIYESSLFLEDYTNFIGAGRPVGGTQSGDSEPAPIRFENLHVERVSFTYPSRAEPSVDDLSLSIRSGEVVAIVGENGSGKTTLAKLLAGLYQPTSGRIRWDDTDARDLDPVRLHASTAVILQDYMKYHLSVRENIGLGSAGRIGDGEGIVEAARRAGMHDFLSALPRGYDTPLGTEFTSATELSGGQWQRIALARAFFRDAPFLILDEPSAALDPRSEAALFDRVRDLYRGRTVLLISHRFSTVRSADRIFVMDRGRIVESGPHDQLMALGGLYAEMFTTQAAAYVG